MEITININRLNEILSYRPDQLLWFLFIRGGWIAVVIFTVIVFFIIRLQRLQGKYLKSIKHNLLAIDIPKDNEQSLLAVEQIFAQLHGIKSSPNLWEKYWLGETQLSVSLEIVSIEGYIQFLIRTPDKFRNLTEAAIYAQYPEAEITEVEDYIDLIPKDVHDLKSDFDLWGTEFILAKDSAYPLKTYKYFEHGLDQIFVDPMASILEVMSKLGKGEQLGLQIIIAPVGDNWKNHGHQVVNKLIGAKAEVKEHLGDKVVKASISWLEKFSEAIFQMWSDIKSEDERRDSHPNLVQYLTGGEKNVVEGIQNKLSKLCFASTFRLYYLANHQAFQKGLGKNAILGAINQFNTSDMNAFEKHKRLSTEADYFWVKKRISWRQKKLIKYYKDRSRGGSTEFYLSTEELATLYHFPTITVKAPLLKRTEWRKAEPPAILPTETARESAFVDLAERGLALKEEKEEAVKTAFKQTQESPLPISDNYIIDESLADYDFNNDYFENKFAKDKALKDSVAGKEDNEESIPNNLPIIN
ncbi:hypothetical protein KJ840_03110 [Patescibacteria group bacterium]|nr:hypothetical protein [Patescibacteria group bacterium]